MILIGREHLLSYTKQFPATRTAVALWLAVATKAGWHAKDDVLSHFPTAKFLTPTMACFYLAAADCVLTVQIAFNSGLLIVLAASQSRKSATKMEQK
jgi:mRNA-degrading endonuclease HigB of HigAB toxin-antitoxin module